MTIAEISIEPSEHLWTALPLFLLAVLVIDVTLSRPSRRIAARLSPLRRWIAAIVLTVPIGVVIWAKPGVTGQAAWWYPVWTVALFWLIAAREASVLVRRRRSRRVMAVAACAVGGSISLLLLARSEFPADRQLLAWGLIGLVTLVIVWSRRSYRQPETLHQGSQRLPFLLRILAACLLGLLLLNPIARHQRVRYDRACLLILLDDSRSMVIRDVVEAKGAEPISRASALNTALAAHRYELDRIGRELDVLAYRFSDRLVSTDQTNVRAKGDYTALGDAIQQAYESALQTDRPIAGVLVCSDGASNLTSSAEPSVAATALAAGRIPLWTLGVGSETPSGQTRSIIPRNLFAPRRVAAMNELPLSAEFSYVGFQTEPVRVELLFDDELVDHKRVACTKAHQTHRTRFTFVPKVGGLHKVTVRAMPERYRFDGPIPSLSQYVHVADEVIRVLYLEGKPRHEGTFIVRALATSDQIRLQKALLARPKDNDLRTVPGGPAGQWESYHVIILGDMTRDQLSTEQMQTIRRHVGDHGCGLAVLGSRGLVGKGALLGTPLAEILPFDVATGWIDQPVAVIPTEAGIRHAVCRIDPASPDTVARWRDLPPMRGACRFGKPKTAAQILAATPSGEPMIVGHHYGAGRVLALAFDATWQWCMMLDDGAQYQRRFWRQVILWLANRRPAVWIAADRPRYQLPLLQTGRQRVEIRAGVDSAIPGQTIEDLRLEAKMSLPAGGALDLALTETGGQYTAAAEPKIDGTYELELIAKSGDREIGRAAGQFIVESPDLEMLHKLADFDLLREMAAQTHPAGGKFIGLDGLSKLLKRIGTHDYRRRHEETLTEQLTQEGRWHVWTIFCLLLLAEWIVRKRRGLV